LFWDASGVGAVARVARPFDPATLHTEIIVGRAWARIPASALLDVAADKTLDQGDYPNGSSGVVNPRFDRQAVNGFGANPLWGWPRRVPWQSSRRRSNTPGCGP